MVVSSKFHLFIVRMCGLISNNEAQLAKAHNNCNNKFGVLKTTSCVPHVNGINFIIIFNPLHEWVNDTRRPRFSPAALSIIKSHVKCHLTFRASIGRRQNARNG